MSGTNGSGKSAVLQGLQCALGASARETGRGTKLEDLVRSGQDEAKVQVSLLSRWTLGVSPAETKGRGRTHTHCVSPMLSVIQ